MQVRAYGSERLGDKRRGERRLGDFYQGLLRRDTMNKYEIVKFEQGDLALAVNVSPEEETVWLSLNEICLLFGRDKSVISRHIKKYLKKVN